MGTSNRLVVSKEGGGVVVLSGKGGVFPRRVRRCVRDVPCMDRGIMCKVRRGNVRADLTYRMFLSSRGVGRVNVASKGRQVGASVTRILHPLPICGEMNHVVIHSRTFRGAASGGVGETGVSGAL